MEVTFEIQRMADMIQKGILLRFLEKSLVSRVLLSLSAILLPQKASRATSLFNLR